MLLKDQKLSLLSVSLPKLTRERSVVSSLTSIIDAHKSCFLVIKSSLASLSTQTHTLFLPLSAPDLSPQVFSEHAFCHAPIQPLSLWHHQLIPSSLKHTAACTQPVACTILELYRHILESQTGQHSWRITHIRVFLLSTHTIKQWDKKSRFKQHMIHEPHWGESSLKFSRPLLLQLKPICRVK